MNRYILIYNSYGEFNLFYGDYKSISLINKGTFELKSGSIIRSIGFNSFNFSPSQNGELKNSVKIYIVTNKGDIRVF